jgi:hypothetical protein
MICQVLTTARSRVGVPGGVGSSTSDLPRAAP